MFFRRLLYFLLLIVLPVLSASPEVLYSQENELEKANIINQKVGQTNKAAIPMLFLSHSRFWEYGKKFLALNIRVRQKALTTLPCFIVLLAITPQGRLLKSLWMGFLSISSCYPQNVSLEENGCFQTVSSI